MMLCEGPPSLEQQWENDAFINKAHFG